MKQQHIKSRIDMDNEKPEQSQFKQILSGICLGIAVIGILIVILGGIDIYHMYAGNDKDNLFWEMIESDEIGKLHSTGYSQQGNRIFIKYTNSDGSREILKVYKKAMVYDKYYFESYTIEDVVLESSCSIPLYNGGIA